MAVHKTNILSGSTVRHMTKKIQVKYPKLSQFILHNQFHFPQFIQHPHPISENLQNISTFRLPFPSLPSPFFPFHYIFTPFPTIISRSSSWKLQIKKEQIAFSKLKESVRKVNTHATSYGPESISLTQSHCATKIEHLFNHPCVSGMTIH